MIFRISLMERSDFLGFFFASIILSASFFTMGLVATSGLFSKAFRKARRNFPYCTTAPWYGSLVTLKPTSRRMALRASTDSRSSPTGAGTRSMSQMREIASSALRNPVALVSKEMNCQVKTQG